jgi:multimeric flavodoxin WrbA
MAPEELASNDAIVIATPTYNNGVSLDMKNLFEGAVVKNMNLKDKIGVALGVTAGAARRYTSS